MESIEAINIIQSLADGINPFTGEIFPKDSPYQNPQMIRALYKSVEALNYIKGKEKRKKGMPQNAGKPWTEAEDKQLSEKFDSGKLITELAKEHLRTVGAIQSRLVKLGKIRDEGAKSFRISKL